MSHRGELARLAQIASPDVGVVTRVAVEHLEFFASVDEIALAERELIENLPWPSATAVSECGRRARGAFAEVARGPRDLVWRVAAARNFARRQLKSAGVEGSAFDFVSPAGRARLELPLIGRHNVMNALAALAAASVWGIGADEAQARVSTSLTPATSAAKWCDSRMDLRSSTIPTTRVPRRLNALAGLLAATPGYRRRILAAGEMLELGDVRAGIASRMRTAVPQRWKN